MISIMTIFIIISTHDLARRSTKNPNEQPQNQRNFNSRPRKEVDPCILFLIKRICHFNSRPRKEVDIEWRKGTGNTDISTHDLARRSTAWEFILCKRIGISTHDLARRSTCPSLRPRSSSILFQLTTSQGGRRVKWSLCQTRILISTHDLARRSTAIFTQKVFLSKSLFVLIAYNIFILY